MAATVTVGTRWSGVGAVRSGSCAVGLRGYILALVEYRITQLVLVTFQIEIPGRRSDCQRGSPPSSVANLITEYEVKLLPTGSVRQHALWLVAVE
jgi:hypothetical protein